MVNMSLAEQRYRFECIAPLIPVYVHEFREQLKQRTMPQELASPYGEPILVPPPIPNNTKNAPMDTNKKTTTNNLNAA